MKKYGTPSLTVGAGAIGLSRHHNGPLQWGLSYVIGRRFSSSIKSLPLYDDHNHQCMAERAFPLQMWGPGTGITKHHKGPPQKKTTGNTTRDTKGSSEGSGLGLGLGLGFAYYPCEVVLCGLLSGAWRSLAVFSVTDVPVSSLSL